MRFKIWLEQNGELITINLQKFTIKINNAIEELLEFAVSRKQSLKNFKIDLNLIKNNLKNYDRLPNLLLDLKNNKNLKYWVDEIYKWYRSNKDSSYDTFKAFQHLSNYEESLNDKEDIDENSYKLWAKEIIDKTKKNMEVIKNEIENILERSNWNGSKVLIEPNEAYEHNRVALDETDSADITVGKNGHFTLFNINDKKEIDDIIEGGEEDEEFFSNIDEKNDYYTLIEELRNPGSSSVGKILTLYTARPVEDRNRFTSTKTLPINMFLTNSLDHAQGLSYDLSTSGGRRDVYRIKINSKYLTQTLDGNIKYYMVRKDNAPVESINLY